jgi:threonine dehydrogenase-like Zn-dependent dehydrogenase
VELTEINAGDVVVYGPGPIGIMCAMLAREQGGRVVLLGVDADTSRMELARRLGVHATVNVDNDSARTTVDELSDGDGADVCWNVQARSRRSTNVWTW